MNNTGLKPISEDQLTANCFKLAWMKYPKTRYRLFHIPNEGKRSKLTGARLKAKGLLPGVPDFAIVTNGVTYWCELKTEKGKLSPAQKNIHEVWEKQNVIVAVVNSLEGFEEWLVKVM